MKNSLKPMFCALAVILLSCMLAETVEASASKGKCYSISTGKTTVYTTSSLRKKCGTVSGSKEIRILSISKKACKIAYTDSDGRTKKGYIPTRAILRETDGKSCRLQKKLTIYRRPGGKSLGSIAGGSKIQVLGTSGKYTQIRCKRSGSTWFAFVKTAALKKAR